MNAQGLEILAIVISLFGGGGAIASFVAIGRWVGRIESRAKDIEELHERLEAVPGLQQMQEFTNRRLEMLEKRHDSTRARAIDAQATARSFSSSDLKGNGE